MRLKVFIFIVVYEGFIKQIETFEMQSKLSREKKYIELAEHTLVTNSNVFPFVVAILMRAKFLSAGVLIDNSWVLTSADSLFLLRETTRTLRIRLGSLNYKKGGIVYPVKYIVIHPKFDDDNPSYDLAMIRLPDPVRYTPSIQPIRMQKTLKETDATHFIVPSWPNLVNSGEPEQHMSKELIKRRRVLSVTHLHPRDSMDCEEDLTSIGVKDTKSMMCLDSGVMVDPCSRDVGAPVVLNGILWGIVSSWAPNDCDYDLAASTFVNLVAAPNISSWIHATRDGHKWESPLNYKKDDIKI